MEKTAAHSAWMRTHPRRGFTLIELVIAIAILSILTSIAMPRYSATRHRAMRAEVPLITDSLRDVQLGWHAANDAWLTAPTFAPRLLPDAEAVPWQPGATYAALGFRPDGAVRGVYRILEDAEHGFEVTGRCDVDEDGVLAEYYATSALQHIRATPRNVY